MKLIETTCPNCGASLKVDMERGFCYCEYCGTKLILDDEVQHVRIDNAEQAGLFTWQLHLEEGTDSADASGEKDMIYIGSIPLRTGWYKLRKEKVMNAVRYFSKSGNTKKIAEAIAEGIGVTAISITEEPVLSDTVDVLFLGGAPYANIMAPELRKYAENLKADHVKKVVLFTTSNWSHRTVKALKKILEEKGIPVSQEHFYAQMLKVNSRTEAAKEFGKMNI